MPQHIGNAGTKAMAWVKHFVLSPSPQLIHVIQQTKPHRLLQSEVADRDNTLVPAAPSRSRPGTEMVLLASAKNVPLTTSQQSREAQAKTNKQLETEALTGNAPKSPAKLDPEVIADRVYRLMQHDLILERERVTRLGE